MSLKTFEGVVSSNKMQKTIVVVVSRKYRESRVGKIVSARKKYKVHCEDPSIAMGDRVAFVECSPMSKEKKFRLLKILRKGDAVESSSVE